MKWVKEYMNEYVFGFGYEAPVQFEANSANGWDDESSFAIVIAADTEEEAASWGGDLAERFVEMLFRNAGYASPPSWKNLGYASWVEMLPSEKYPQSILKSLPKVRVNEVPQMEHW